MDGKKEVALNQYEDVIKPHLNRDTIHNIYARWANSYDQDIELIAKRREPFVSGFTNELFGTNKTIKILDVGAGTGIAGQMLRQAGYENIDAIDGSPEMLEVAKGKKIFQRIICEYLGPKRLDIGDGTYDLLMCLGALLSTHVSDEAFTEMIRITKPGGYIVFMIGLQSIGEGKARIDAAMQKLHDEGKWEWVVKRILNGYHNVRGEDNRGLVVDWIVSGFQFTRFFSRERY